MLRYRLTSPQATFITPRTAGDEKKPYDAYLGAIITKDGMLEEYAFCVHGPELDRVVAERLGALAAADVELANRIRQFMVVHYPLHTVVLASHHLTIRLSEVALL